MRNTNEIFVLVMAFIVGAILCSFCSAQTTNCPSCVNNNNYSYNYSYTSPSVEVYGGPRVGRVLPPFAGTHQRAVFGRYEPYYPGFRYVRRPQYPVIVNPRVHYSIGPFGVNYYYFRQ